MNIDSAATHLAIWVPSWYELDQPMRVNDVGRFVFFQSTPTWLNEQSPLGEPSTLGDVDFVFFNQLLNDTPWEARTARVVSIVHPLLGQLSAVDTCGLDYKFTLADGQILCVNAEEDPGHCEDAEVDKTGWSLKIWFAGVSQPLECRDDATDERKGFSV